MRTQWRDSTNSRPSRARVLAAPVLISIAALLGGCGSSAGAAATWSAVTAPLPAGATSGELVGVSCPTSTTCFAVGDSSRGTIKTLVVRRNAGSSSWSVVASPSPSGASSSRLAGIACPTSTACFAVGQSAGHALVDRWNGKVWTIVEVPQPSEVRTSGLNGVACPGVTSCFAVGQFQDRSGPQKTLIERWNGTTWTIVSHPKLSGGNRYLFAVACGTSTSCFAVGTHSVTGGGELSCEPELDCSATTLVEQWNGKHWTVVASPNGPYPALQSTLTGLSCASATSCVVVGVATPRGTWGTMLTERWNGKQWTIGSAAIPAGAVGSELYGVSCSTSTSCFAAGAYQTSTGARTIVDHYNGSQWSIARRPGVSGALRGVSCVSATTCVAVGGRSIQQLGRSPT